MPTDEAQSPRFDERAALKELERLRDAIENSRRRRSRTSDEFEAFVRSFRTPSASPAASSTDVIEQRDQREQPQQRNPPPPPPQVEQRLPIERAALVEQPTPVDQPSPVDQPPPAIVEHAEPPAAVQSAPASKRVTRSFLPLALGIAAILVVAVVLLIRTWNAVRSGTAESPSTGGAATTASEPPSTTPAPAAAPAPPPLAPASAHAMEAELSVQRRVWVRVLVDGQRTIERELPAGTRIPLQADRAIVIRAGDAGALRLTINGVDRGPLGKDSEILTRTFTAPETPAR